jgi:hypothetical protein
MKIRQLKLQPYSLWKILENECPVTLKMTTTVCAETLNYLQQMTRLEHQAWTAEDEGQEYLLNA